MLKEMKKSAHKGSAHRTTRQTKGHPHLKKLLLILCILLVLLFIFPPTGKSMAQIIAHTGLFKASAPINWPPVEGAASYNIYYRIAPGETNQDPAYVYSVRNIPGTQTAYMIKNLKRGETYQYKITAVNAMGEEFMWTTFQENHN
jgi:hypothetical protein